MWHFTSSFLKYNSNLLKKRVNSSLLVEPAFAVAILDLIFLIYHISNIWNLLQLIQFIFIYIYIYIYINNHN